MCHKIGRAVFPPTGISLIMEGVMLKKTLKAVRWSCGRPRKAGKLSRVACMRDMDIIRRCGGLPVSIVRAQTRANAQEGGTWREIHVGSCTYLMNVNRRISSADVPVDMRTPCAACPRRGTRPAGPPPRTELRFRSPMPCMGDYCWRHFLSCAFFLKENNVTRSAHAQRVARCCRPLRCLLWSCGTMLLLRSARTGFRPGGSFFQR